MKIYLLLISTIIFAGCDTDLNEAEPFPYSTASWSRLNKRVTTGEGNNEFEQNRDELKAKKEIDALKDKLFVTYRSVYRVDDWKNRRKNLKYWGKINEGNLPYWEDKVRPKGEPIGGTNLPWIITNYDYKAESFTIMPAPFDCFYNSKLPGANASYLRCFGDPPPTTRSYDEGLSFLPLFVAGDSWSWYNEEVLRIEMNQEDAEIFVNSLLELSFLGLKIYYKYFDSFDNAVIVKIEGYTTLDDNTIKVLFETDYNDDKDGDTTYRAGGSDSYYWSLFTL